MSVTGYIFSIETVRTQKGTIFRLKVNFTPEIIVLTKEVLFCFYLSYFNNIFIGTKFKMAWISSTITIGK
jgi:hypothetical protein